jgi:hypothetical protein
MVPGSLQPYVMLFKPLLFVLLLPVCSMARHLFIYSFLSFYNGVCAQSLILAGQMLYHLSHTLFAFF